MKTSLIIAYFISVKENEHTTSKMLDQILRNQNMNEARKKVRANKRSAGIEGITIDDLDSYIKKTGGL